MEVIARVSGNDHDRISKTREKLNILLDRGYKYIVADEDGDYWTGSSTRGLEIQEVMSSPFMGEIQVDE